MSNWDLHKFCK